MIPVTCSAVWLIGEHLTDLVHHRHYAEATRVNPSHHCKEHWHACEALPLMRRPPSLQEVLNSLGRAVYCIRHSLHIILHSIRRGCAPSVCVIPSRLARLPLRAALRVCDEAVAGCSRLLLPPPGRLGPIHTHIAIVLRLCCCLISAIAHILVLSGFLMAALACRRVVGAPDRLAAERACACRTHACTELVADSHPHRTNRGKELRLTMKKGAAACPWAHAGLWRRLQGATGVDALHGRSRAWRRPVARALRLRDDCLGALHHLGLLLFQLGLLALLLSSHRDCQRLRTRRAPGGAPSCMQHLT